MPAVVIANNGDVPEFEGRITFSVFVCVVIAACGGLMFGYDIGVSGGVTAMDDFLKKFFYQVWERKQEAHENNYCKYDNKKLQLFTSSLYIAALIASFLASKMCSKYGRKPTMQLASIFFIGGVALTTFAVNIEMLIIGRLLLGCGVGFANQAVPLFLSELAPAKIRGALNISFQLFITIGILVANIVNYVVGKIHPYGFRISLGIAGVPALLLCFGSLAIYETPTSLIERKKVEQGRAVLKKIRGVDNVDLEYDSIVHACEVASQITQPYHELMKRESRPPLVIAIVMQVFQQFTGINAIMFYAPVLFQTVGFGSDAALLSSVVTGLVNVLSTTVSVVLVDKVGRRALLLEACVQMLITQCIIGGVLMKDLKTTGTLPNGDAMVVVIMVCVFVAGFAWSWGPLGWLIPSETFPLETRTAGFSFAVSSNMLFTFVIAQAFLSTLCHLKAGIFFFFAAWIVVMGLFALFLLPETKGVPVDEMVDRVWKQHWFWKRFFNDEQVVEKKAIEMIHPHVT
ncbi:sugar transport protein 8-like [Populus alba x Populus x berolinensis]|uniref:Monosaccharide transporter n=2 Tax=Populus alba TaxID=43335 RepID=A0A4U5NJY0_POPAL|nr:sugar transport protein 8-like [Populus alba]KAJ6911033.1 sugar transport protein 8-like [Populus alba x Populus x berolinensis]TKR83657.1 monosaccharide transporter [Populus alba]